MSSLGQSQSPSPWERIGRLIRRIAHSYVLVLVLGVIVGLQVAPVVADLGPGPDRGTVAVIPVSGGIDGENAASVATRLKQAREDPSYDAAVLHVNSPGGGASASETIYLQSKRTAEEIPLVASVDAMAASGGYYALAPARTVFVKPASLIGSIGVIFVAPQELPPVDRVIQSGPDKLTGADRREWYYKTEAVQRAFVGAVLEHRADRLEMSRDELEYASLYAGSEAVENGIADRIGDLEAAISHAADEADLDRYDVEVLEYDGDVEFITRSNYVAANTEAKTLRSPQSITGDPDGIGVPNVLMVPPTLIDSATVDDNTTEVRANETASP